jgi:small-conductance mechanosensitive channel
MKLFKNLSVIVPAILLAICLLAYYSTRESAKPTAPQPSAEAEQQLVDTSLLQSAVKLAPLAASLNERGQAREAWRLADHELDLTFAAAMREAEEESTLPATGPLRQLSDRIIRLKARVEADKKRVAELGKDSSEVLDRAKAQLDLDQDELDNVQQEFAREGGDKRASLQRLLQEHEASDKVADQTITFFSPGATRTLSEQLREWFSVGEYDSQLRTAGQKATAHARMLLDQHNTLERQLLSQSDSSASLARLRQLSGQRKRLAGLDQRMQDTKQLVAVYQRWGALVENRQRAVLHLLLRSLAIIIAILLVTALLNRAFHLAFRQTDRHRLHQLRVIARITLQVTAVLLILLILFGPPTQLSTAVGLVTAGLAVVMKDFIVAFFGWFTLMGKNGISVGDWVEIEGVSGEVIEIGLLKTVLLELGNWTDAGHPTGRHVAFSNSFAMERHYFNFSTVGQWLWDEIQVMLPREGDPYETAQKIRKIIERETQADAAEAVKDWQRIADKYGAREISAMPSVNLRPGVNGLEVVVRYITRAPQRNAVKSKLFQAIVDLLHKPA